MKSFAFNILTLYMCHFFFIGYEPFQLDMILQLGREEKLWMTESETRAGSSGERPAALGPPPALHAQAAPSPSALPCCGGFLVPPCFRLPPVCSPQSSRIM